MCNLGFLGFTLLEKPEIKNLLCAPRDMLTAYDPKNIFNPTQIFFGWHFCFRVVFYSEVSFAMHVRAFSIVDAVIAMSMGRGIQLLAHVNIAKLCQATAEGIFRQNSILPASCALQASPAWSMV